MSLFWEMHQQHQINDAGIRANAASSKADRMYEEVVALRRQVDKLSLTSQALWEVLRDNSDFAEEHLLSKIEEIDLRDGVLDGKISAGVLNCRACGRKTNSKRTTCIFCGEIVQKNHIFE